MSEKTALGKAIDRSTLRYKLLSEGFAGRSDHSGVWVNE